MVSLSRRQVLVGGAVSVFVPSIAFASPDKLILSGRVVTGRTPVAGASFVIGGNRVTTDADGRFMTVTDTVAYSARGACRDGDGAWRATVALQL